MDPGIVCIAPAAVLIVFLLVLIIRSQTRPDFHGMEKMVGKTGFVQRIDPLKKNMRVAVNGESWIAVSDSLHLLAKDDSVVVTKVDMDTLTITVEPEGS